MSSLKKQLISSIVDQAVSSAAKALKSNPSPKKKKRNRRRNRNNNNNATKVSVVNQGTYGISMVNRKFSMGGTAQRLTDYSVKDSLRVSGSAMLAATINFNTGNPTAFYGAVAWKSLTPYMLDNRLQNIAQIFDFYSFRHIKVTYVPYVQPGTGYSNALAVGLVSTYAEASEDITPTPNEILALPESFMTNITTPTSIVCDCRGTKLFPTNNSAGYASNIQYMIAAVFLSQPTVSSLVGAITVEYVCDFYQPSLKHSAVVLSSSKDEEIDEPDPPTPPHKTPSKSSKN